MNKKHIKLPVDGLNLPGELVLPPKTKHLVIFSYGSSSCLMNASNRKIAKKLQNAGFGTLMIDLLDMQEDEEEYRFDIDLLTRRLTGVTTTIRNQIKYRTLNLVYFGIGIGAASALKAAARQKDTIKAVVSYRGRPDLVKKELPEVNSPTLFVVGEYDLQTIKLNEQVLRYLKSPRQLVVVPAASHFFEEPGKLNQLAKITIAWLDRCLATKMFTPYAQELNTN
jgi:pimeloyl-ACP methyl ester carboxylesterase